MHLHILGIGGTFMSALALLARDAGFQVTGSDANCYPPISDLLADKKIQWVEGYEDSQLALSADCVVIGNAIKRGMPVLEAVLNTGKRYTSGPQWLAEHILPRYRVIAVSGTHGKTTTTSMLAHILSDVGKEPGFLIGGVAPNFNTSNRLGTGEWFIIEADEYDSAFFDKRPKLMHYRPEIAILNNLEFDHADIYDNLAAIEQQFHFYLKTIPSKGMIIKPKNDQNLNQVIARGIFSHLEECALRTEADWTIEDITEGFSIYYQKEKKAEVHWSLLGDFNKENALAAIAASYHAGVEIQEAANALNRFIPPKRRLELKAQKHGVSIYDDFAHHPTAIRKTLEALKASGRHQRIFAVLECASYTMRTGLHGENIAKALELADQVILLQPEFSLERLHINNRERFKILPNTETIIKELVRQTAYNDAILIMSNRGFENIHQRLVEAMEHHNQSMVNEQ